ncbi:MAG: DUF192 domain-containing protein [Myxococcaceae bacterium]
MTYQVVNRTRGRILGNEVQEARTFSQRFLGLMGRRDLPFGQGLHIVPCNSIHTFFMRIPIDVAFLDGQRRVVKLIPALPPWRASSVYFKARSVLELPSGAFAGSGTCEGDELSFVEIP